MTRFPCLQSQNGVDVLCHSFVRWWHLAAVGASVLNRLRCTNTTVSPLFSPLGHAPRKRIAGSYRCSIFQCLKNILSQNGWLVCIPSIYRGSCFPTSLQMLLIFCLCWFCNILRCEPQYLGQHSAIAEDGWGQNGGINSLPTRTKGPHLMGSQVVIIRVWVWSLSLRKRWMRVVPGGSVGR